MPKLPRDKRTSKLKFSDYFFPARPRKFIKKTSKAAIGQFDDFLKPGTARASNPAYVRWLRKSSMLYESNRLSSKYIGQGSMWRNPYGKPRPRNAIKQASVWFTAYPISQITKPGQSIVSSLAEKKLWDAFQEIGIDGLHTGPMKLAGGISGWQFTPSVDGHFDRISTTIDPMFGTETEFVRMARVAAQHDSIIIDDIVPGHTGKGADFRLAEMAYKDYPGIYHMVEIHPDDWHHFPAVPKGQDAVNINQHTEEQLKSLGYIIGKLQRVIFYEPGVKDTNWSATKAVKGVDGVKRRWVYLHYFKEGQPSINWIDPTFAGMRLVIGDALHSLGELHSRGLRLDANGFLGVEKGSESETAWSEGHPLSEASNHFIASMVRKLNGFTFQELNLTFEDIKLLSNSGADLSYDFINRPAYHHALATGDTEFLRLTLRSALDLGIDPASLIHALQNHDDLTYELVHFWTAHKNDIYQFRDKKVTGGELRQLIRREMTEHLVENSNGYNLPFTENGVACTSVSAIAAILGIKNFDSISSGELEKIKKAHLLLAMFNCLQPGIFALSGWDLTGAFTLRSEQVEDLMHDGDTRWINRGAYDLIGVNPAATESSGGIPKAPCLYGDLRSQLKDQNSFARQLQKILEIRKKYAIATSRQVDIPEIRDKQVLAMVHKLSEASLQVTILNFGSEPLSSVIRSEYFIDGAKVNDMFSGDSLSRVSGTSLKVDLEPYQGRSLLVTILAN